jgi:hypothetical protein
MDSKHFPNFGDAEWTPRFKRAGWNLLIDPRSRVFCQPNAEFQRIRNLSLAQMANVLLLNLGHPNNLRRRFYANWYGGPSRLKGVAAFTTFLARIPFGSSNESTTAEPERPLADLFS